MNRLESSRTGWGDKETTMADYDIPASAAFDITLGGKRRGVIYGRAQVEGMLLSWLREHGGDASGLADCEIIQLPEPPAMREGQLGREVPWTAFVRPDTRRAPDSGEAAS